MIRCILFFIIVLIQASTFAQTNKKPSSRPHYHEFDFWLGNWDVYKFNTDTLLGKSTISSVLDSCGIEENYSSVKTSYKGKSLNKYHEQNKRWEQYYIDNSGTTLHLTGNLQGRSMVLEDNPVFGGTKNKISWTPQPEGEVRQTWEVSADGETWQVIFDGLYKRR